MAVQVVSTTRARRRSRVEQEKNIFELKSGIHKGKFLVKAPNGRTAQGQLLYKRFGPFVDLDEAIAARDKHIADLAAKAIQGVKSLPVGRQAAPKTLSEWAAHYLDVQCANKLASGTLAKYRNNFDMHLLPHLGHYALGALTKAIIEAWRESLVEGGLGGATVNYCLKRLKTCLNAAVNDTATTGLKENVATRVDFVEVAKTERESNFADFPLLQAAAGDHHLAAVIPLVYDAGLRESEVVALRWCDLELDRLDPRTGKPAPRLVLRYHTVSSGSVKKGQHTDAFRPGTKTSKGKTEYQRISVPMAAMLKAHGDRLVAHKLASRPWAKLAGKRTKFFYGKTKNDRTGEYYVVPQNPIAPDALVFPSSDGTPLMTANISGWFARVCEAAGVVKTFHGMRHDCGSFQLADGVPLAVVSKHLRHANVAITADTYMHQIGEQEGFGADAWGARWAALDEDQAAEAV